MSKREIQNQIFTKEDESHVMCVVALLRAVVWFLHQWPKFKPVSFHLIFGTTEEQLKNYQCLEVTHLPDDNLV